MANASTLLEGLPPQAAEVLKAALLERELQNMTLERGGTKITLPAGMTCRKAVTYLTRKMKEEEETLNVVEQFDGFPFDVAHALALVIHEVFGDMQGYSTWWEQQTFISIEVSPGVRKQVPWGPFQVPGVEAVFRTGFAKKDNRVIFSFSAEIKGKDKGVFELICNKLRDKMVNGSIYKGQAIKISFRDEDDARKFFDPSVQPQFMKLDGPDKAIFTRDTEEQIALSVLNPVKHSKRCKQMGITLKRAVLLEGDYGTGKTLTALETARVCTDNEWTFVYVDDSRDLDLAIELAEQYAPAVVFAEDVDRVMAAGNRDNAIDQLSYVLDGVDNKDRDIMVVLTTNNVNGIHKLMLRPGRIDDVISIQKPDADTVYRLLVHNGGSSLNGTKKEFIDAIQPMVGQNPAFVCEVLKKAKLSAVGALVGDEPLLVTPDDIRSAVKIMDNHVKLMNGPTVVVEQRLAISKMEVLLPAK